MLVLASNSPRRKELLALSGLDFTVIVKPVDETVLPGESPGEYVLRLAQDKAYQAARELPAPALEDILVIAADTCVVDDNAILGKPADATEAEQILRRLRGRNHQVCTAIAVLRVKDGRLLSGVCTTSVPMRRYRDEDISAYIATGDPFDKAGAYAIQHAGFRPVLKLRGCYANVMGLPLCHLMRLFQLFEVAPATDIAAACQQALQYTCPIHRKVFEATQPFDIG